MRRKHHKPIPPEALDEPFGPPPERYFVSLPGLQGRDAGQ